VWVGGGGIVVVQVFSGVRNRIEFVSSAQKVDDVKGGDPRSARGDFDHSGTGRGVRSEGLNHHYWETCIAWPESRYREAENGVGKEEDGSGHTI
jgi:hypothetical protein